MLDQDRHSDLRRLYTLFLRVPDELGRQSLRLALRSDIEERGKVINEGETSRAGPSSGQAEQDDEDEDMSGKAKGKGKERVGTIGGGANALSLALRWVQEVLDLKDKFDRILEEAFVGDKAVQMSINEVSSVYSVTLSGGFLLKIQAFQSFINANPRAPEYLSLFIDEHLKKGTKAVRLPQSPSLPPKLTVPVLEPIWIAHADGQKSEDEIETALEKTIILFRFLSDKDRFERYYKNHLAKRLLYGRSASDDSERGMVAKLKVEM